MTVEIFGWIIWAILVFFALGSLYFFLTSKEGVQAQTMERHR